MERILLDSFDNIKLSVNLWDKVESPKACIVISHGMAEHPDRYDDFALFLNSKGYIVAADEHRGHRNNAIGKVNGQTQGDSWNQTLKDIDALVDYMKKTYKLDVVLLGHSYGSFLSQRYIEMHSDKLVGCVLSGTAYMKSALVGMGLKIASLQKAIFGEKKTGKLINKMSFGAYNKPFVDDGLEFAWLSRDKQQVIKYQNDKDCGYALSIGFYYYFFKGVMEMYGEDANSIRKDFPIMIAVGSDDPVNGNMKNAHKLNDFYKGLGLDPVYKIYEKARHEILNEINNKEVYNDILEFIDNLFA
ncbi:MAG: alpha/beta hydrolase [Clostridiales bacterium]|nr:alpha/beta hydrolase [Clostridiales bacterium]